MFSFYVVVRHKMSGLFSSVIYKTNNEILTEDDLLKIEKIHAHKSSGTLEVTTQIISWQRINIE